MTINDFIAVVSLCLDCFTIGFLISEKLAKK